MAFQSSQQLLAVLKLCQGRQDHRPGPRDPVAAPGELEGFPFAWEQLSRLQAHIPANPAEGPVHHRPGHRSHGGDQQVEPSPAAEDHQRGDVSDGRGPLEGGHQFQQLLQALSVPGEIQVHRAIAAEASVAIWDQGHGLLAEEVAVQLPSLEIAAAVGIVVLPIHLGGPPLTLGPGQQAE